MTTLPQSDPLAVEVVRAIRAGDVAAVEALIRDHSEMPRTGFVGRRGTLRTPLHVVTDWPGFFPNGPEMVRLLVAAGADVNAGTGGSKSETPLHWAASSDDADVAEALIDGGADLEVPNGSIGTPLDNAIGYACWQVAHVLVRRGARVERLWQAAALGLLPRLQELLPGATPAQINQAFWHACSGGQRRTAETLLAHGAEMQFVPEYARTSPLGAVTAVETRRQTLAEWLREHGAS